MSGTPHPLVFVSHAAEDKAVADAVCSAIEAAGVRCWIAPRDIITGANWAKSILDGIAGAKLMVLVFSHHTSKSPHVRREIERAVHRDVPIAPLRIEDVMPEGDLEYFLSSQHWSDLFPGPIEQRILEVPTKVCALLGVEPMQPKPPPPLPKKPEPPPAPKEEKPAPEPAPVVKEIAPPPPARKPPPIPMPQPAPAPAPPAASYPQAAPTPPPPAPAWQQPAPSRRMLPWVMGAIIGGVAIILLMIGLVAADKAGWFETSEDKSQTAANSTTPPPPPAPAPVAPIVTPTQDATPSPPIVFPAPVDLQPTIANSIFMKFVLIHPGTFTMGDNDGFADEKPAHQVSISKPFYLQECEVTQGHWMTVMGTTPQQQRDPVNASMYLPGEGDNMPMCFVSWDDAQRFCQKLSSMDGHKYRLPSEAEWEYACRAGSKTSFSFGNNIEMLDDHGWSTNNANNAFHPVEQWPANVWGLYDMHGNVWEWCEDFYGPYTFLAQTDPIGPLVADKHVLRGGSWANKPNNCRSAIRLSRAANIIANDTGFRVVMEIDH